MKKEINIKQYYDSWIDKNIERFHYVPYVFKSDSNELCLRFMGIIPEVSLRIGADYIWFTTSYPHRLNDFADCDADIVELFEHADKNGNLTKLERVYNISEKELWENHIFNFMLDWINKRFQQDMYLYVFSCYGGMPIVSGVWDFNFISRIRNELEDLESKTRTEFSFFTSIFENRFEHSEELIKIRKETNPNYRRKSIELITCNKPLLTLYLSPRCDLYDETGSFDNQPIENFSLPCDKPGDVSLRGKAVFIGKFIYIVIFADKYSSLKKKHLDLLRKSKWKIIDRIQRNYRHLNEEIISTIRFIDDTGNSINL